MQAPENLPIDARLLSEAIIELNISRRSVGLYPPGHAMITSAIGRAYALFEKLFDVRPSITLGIAKDALVIDESLLDRQNPVYRECARSFFRKGLAGITFRKGLSVQELTALHQLLISENIRSGEQFVQEARNRSLTHILVSPIDYESFRFVEDRFRTPEAGESVWADYVYGLLHGTLTTDESETAVTRIPADEVARVLNSLPQEEPRGDSYDRIIATYLKEKGEARLNQESYGRFISLVDNLSPAVKRQFLERARDYTQGHEEDVERVLRDMTSEQFEQVAKGLMGNGSMLPPTLTNVMDKLAALHKGRSFAFEMFQQDGSVFHDIPVTDSLASLFTEDHFASYVKDGYRQEVEAFMKKPEARFSRELDIRKDCAEEVVDRIATEIMIEAMESAEGTGQDYLHIITRLAEFAGLFVDTGRFEDALNIYNTIYGHSLNSQHKEHARNTVTFYFHAPAFIERLVQGALTWGRRDREGLIRLARVMRSVVAEPLLAALKEEKDAAHRKLLLSVLSSFGSDLAPLLVAGLKDERWYVIRNMLFLLRVCDGKQYAPDVERLAKHSNPVVSMEALKALLHFQTPSSVPLLKVFLRSDKDRLRQMAVRVAGTEKLQAGVPFMVEWLERKKGPDVREKIAIIQALAQIGDAKALPALSRILETRSLLFRNEANQLKLAAVESLKYYRPEEAGPLLEKALRSRDADIRAAAERGLRSARAGQEK